MTAVADLRSAPYSKMYPAFNREALAKPLKEHGIAYVYLGRELGARSDDPSCYQDGKVQYRRLAQTHSFRSGLRARATRVRIGNRHPSVCREGAAGVPPGDPGRTWIWRSSRGARLSHSRGWSTERHERLLKRLLKLHGLDQPDLFRTREECIDLAYARQEAGIAYVDHEGRDVTDEEP